MIQVKTVLSQLSACSFSLRSRLRLTSQLYTLAVLTSMIVSCSLRNSRSSTVFVKLVCAPSSFDLSSSIAVGILYDSITFAFRTAIERHAGDVSAKERRMTAENAPRAIGRRCLSPPAPPPRKACLRARTSFSVVLGGHRSAPRLLVRPLDRLLLLQVLRSSLPVKEC